MRYNKDHHIVTEDFDMFDGQDKEKGALEKLNEIAMEMQEIEESMAFMDEYARKFYKLAREDEKSFRKMMSEEYAKKSKEWVSITSGVHIKTWKLLEEIPKELPSAAFFEAKYAKMRQYVIFDEDIRIMI